MTIAGLDGMPLTGPVLEAATPLRWVGTVASIARSVLGLDHAESLAGDQTEALGIVGEQRHMDGVLAMGPSEVD